MRANNGVNLFELSESGSIEESKKIIQTRVINNYNYGTIIGSFADEASRVHVTQTIDEKPKKELLEKIKLFLEVIIAISVVVGVINGFIQWLNSLFKKG